MNEWDRIGIVSLWLVLMVVDMVILNALDDIVRLLQSMQ